MLYRIGPTLRAARALAVILLCAFCGSGAPRAVVLTTDCGADIDDQWALAHLVLSPEFDVRAVITTHTGRHAILPAPAAESTARVARDVLAHLPLRRPPDVIAGSSIPLTSRAPFDERGVERILSEARGFRPDHRLTVLIIGAATDTASALLKDPSLAARIELIAMGFNRWPEGGNEFNIGNDPIAWQVVLDSNVPVTVGDAEVCKRDLMMTAKRAHRTLNPAGDPGRYLAGLLDEWLASHTDTVRAVTGDASRWPIWDEVTVASLLGMTKSETRPRPKLRQNLTFEFSSTQRIVQWITDVQADRLWSDLRSRLQNAELRE